MTALDAFKQTIGTTDLPEIGPQSRSSSRPVPDLERALSDLFSSHRLPETLRPYLRSAALLWHDHLDESHTISQNLSDATGSLLHGIMHRREPDYGNAKYWFHRTGPHPAYPLLAQQLTAEAAALDPALVDRLVPDGQWNPDAFVDACQEAAAGRVPAKPLQRVQQMEFEALLQHLFSQ